MVTTSSRFVLLCVLSSVRGLFPLSRVKCPNIPLEENFNLTQYLGKWYDVESLGSPTQRDQRCLQVEYSLNTDGTIKINNTGVKDVKSPSSAGAANVTTSTVSQATVVNASRPAAWRVAFQRPPAPFLFGNPTQANYEVLDTDYTTYSLVYTCSRSFGFIRKVDRAWILSRTNQKPAQTEQLKALLTSHDIDVKNFRSTDFSNC